MPSRRPSLRGVQFPADVFRPCRRQPHLRSAGDRPGREHRWNARELHLDGRHRGTDTSDRLKPAGADQQRRRELRLLRQPIRADRASPPSNAAATARASQPCTRRRPTPASPTAATASRCGRSTRRGTSTGRRRASPGRVDTAAPTTSIDSGPAGADQLAPPPTSPSRAAIRQDPASPRFECRRDGQSFAAVHSPADLFRPRRRQPHLRGPGDRPGGERRRIAGELHLDRRHRGPDHLDRLASAGAHQLRRQPASPSQAPTPGGSGVASFECRRDGRACAACTSPADLLRPRRRQPHLRGPSDRPGRERRRVAGELHLDRRHRGPEHHHRLASAGADQLGRRELHLLRLRSGRLRASPRFECRRDGQSFAPCTSPQSLLRPRRRQPHLRGPGDRPGRERRRLAGELHLDASTPRRRAPDRLRPAGADQQRRRRLHLLGLRRRRLGRRFLRMPSRRPSLASCSLAADLLRPRRRQPHLRGPGDRPGRERRRDSGRFTWTVDTTAPTPRSTRIPRR